MDWSAQIDGYCERLGPGVWAEPLNAVTNAAFLIAAVLMWRRSAGLIEGQLLSAILAAIGVGSVLFHTFATVWAAVADVVPIGLFILTYLYLVARHFLGWPVWGAVLATAGFIPYAAALTALLDRLPFFEVSNFYWTVPILIAAVAPFVPNRRTGRGMLIGAAILVVSISLRSVDETLCARIPMGTHIWWHILNGVMLGWMIEVYRRHRLEAAGAGG